MARQANTSVAAVALANGLNANMLRRWVRESEVAEAAHGDGQQQRDAAVAAFVQLRMCAQPTVEAARRLNRGSFVWSHDAGPNVTLTRAQFDALVLGLRWQCVGEAGVITLL